MKIEGTSSQITSFGANKSNSIMETDDAKKVVEANLEEQQKQTIAVNQEDKEKENNRELSREEIGHVVNGLNELLKPKFTSLNFKVHDKLDRYYVEVIDEETKKVIREIPEKEILDMYAKMTEFLGLFIDKKL